MSIAIVVKVVFAIFGLWEGLAFTATETTVGAGSFARLTDPRATEVSACIAFAAARFGIARQSLPFFAADLWAVGDAFVDLSVAVVVEPITDFVLGEVLLCAFAPFEIGLTALKSSGASAEIQGVLGCAIIAGSFGTDDFAKGGASVVCVVDFSVAIIVAIVGALLFCGLWIFALFGDRRKGFAIAPE